jgi:hypothetical protein
VVQRQEIRFSNFHIDVLAEGDAALKLAVQLAMFGQKAVTHWKVVRGVEDRTRHQLFVPDDEKGYLTLILLWHPDTNSTPLPFPLSGDTLVAFIRDWLLQLKPDDRPPYPTHDGSNHDGFRVFTTAWGHVYGMHYSIFGVQAAWAEYGK